MRNWMVIGSVALAASAFLAYRVVSLEGRVRVLAGRLGTPAKSPSAEASSQHPEQGYEARLIALEHEVKALREDLHTLEAATGIVAEGRGADPAQGTQQILSVVEKEQRRLFERQLEFQRKRWLELREATLETFAQQNNLTPQQVDQLKLLLTRELDGMIALLRRKESLENPEQASSDWMVLLEETDRSAKSILNPAQIDPWNTARTIERRVLWPWLPIDSTH